VKGVRTTVRTTRKYARCLDCGRAWSTPNALAVAARHCAAFRHTVTADTATAHTYSPTSPDRMPSRRRLYADAVRAAS
jgi:hypothetical protein